VKVVGLDPAGNAFGVCGIEVSDNGKLELYMSTVIESLPHWKADDKNTYMAHVVASLLYVERPDVVVSEDPFGIGWSVKRLGNLLGSIKATVMDKIVWQGVGEARRAVLGDGYGAASKKESADWLLSYDWNIGSKRAIKKLIEAAALANNEEGGKDGYDILDAVMHVICYLVASNKIVPVHKEPKVKKPKKKKTE
jgi:Holliday junction resolvasome RuvABC endonuclease subunit